MSSSIITKPAIPAANHESEVDLIPANQNPVDVNDKTGGFERRAQLHATMQNATDNRFVTYESLFRWTGECPYWDVRTGQLSLVDACTAVGAGRSRVMRLHPETSELRSYEREGCASFNIPASDVRFSVVSRDNDLVLFDWLENDRETLLAVVDRDKPGNRFNDAKCDSHGVLLAGTMSMEISPAVLAHPGCGSLFRYRSSADGPTTATMVDTGHDLSNGLDWTADGSSMFFADSIKRVVYVFDYDAASSSPSNRRVCLDFSSYESAAAGGEQLGLPDGMCLDTDGRLWVTCYGAGKVVQFDVATGRILHQIKLPTVKTTSCCFGGPQLTDLFVTSARYGPTDVTEHAGSLFKLPGDVHGARGLPMKPFQL